MDHAVADLETERERAELILGGKGSGCEEKCRAGSSRYCALVCAWPAEPRRGVLEAQLRLSVSPRYVRILARSWPLFSAMAAIAGDRLPVDGDLLQELMAFRPPFASYCVVAYSQDLPSPTRFETELHRHRRRTILGEHLHAVHLNDRSDGLHGLVRNDVQQAPAALVVGQLAEGTARAKPPLEARPQR